MGYPLSFFGKVSIKTKQDDNLSLGTSQFFHVGGSTNNVGSTWLWRRHWSQRRHRTLVVVEPAALASSKVHFTYLNVF